MKTNGVLLLAILAFSGCELLDDSDVTSTLQISVDAAVIHVGERTEVVINNGGRTSLRLPNCGGVVLEIEAQDDNGWNRFGGVNSPCPAIHDMSPLNLPAQDNARAYFAIYESGIYRLVLRPENAETAYSASFEVVP